MRVLSDDFIEFLPLLSLSVTRLFSVKLSQGHATKVKAYEQKRQENLRERQEAFHDAFQADMDHYRKHGKIERE